MSRGSRPQPPPPKFLIDRSLGVQLREAIQARGYEVETLRSVYGEAGAQKVADVKWIREAAAKGQLILTKDDGIRRNALEQRAMRRAKAKGCCLPSGHMKTDEMRSRFLDNLNRIIQRGGKPGPYVYGVYVDHLKLLWP